MIHRFAYEHIEYVEYINMYRTYFFSGLALTDHRRMTDVFFRFKSDLPARIFIARANYRLSIVKMQHLKCVYIECVGTHIIPLRHVLSSTGESR